MNEEDMSSCLIVSQNYHLMRCRALFQEQGVLAYTVPAQANHRLIKEPYFIARECAAFSLSTLSAPFRNR